MMINPDYAKPILTLANALTEQKIPHTLNVIHDGLQIRFPWCKGDFICHNWSYGHESGWVESLGFPWDYDDVSCSSVEEAIANITSLWQKIGA